MFRMLPQQIEIVPASELIASNDNTNRKRNGPENEDWNAIRNMSYLEKLDFFYVKSALSLYESNLSVVSFMKRQLVMYAEEKGFDFNLAYASCVFML